MEACWIKLSKCQKNTIVFWLLLDVFHTNSKLFLFGKRKSEQCDLCGAPKEDRIHFVLVCPSLHIIRNDFLLQIVSLSPCIIPYLEPTETLLVAILDPESPILPDDLIESWPDIPEVYKVMRNMIFALYNKREALLDDLLKSRAIL